MKSERHVQEGLWMGYYKREKSRLKKKQKTRTRTKNQNLPTEGHQTNRHKMFKIKVTYQIRAI